MDVEIKRVVISERQHGVALLLAVIEYPVCELPGGYFEKYYTSVRDNVSEWLYEREISRVRDEYEQMCKHLHTPRFLRYDYRLRCHAACEQGYINVTCEFNYSRSGNFIKQAKLHHTWCTDDGLMLKRAHKNKKS